MSLQKRRIPDSRLVKRCSELRKSELSQIDGRFNAQLIISNADINAKFRKHAPPSWRLQSTRFSRREFTGRRGQKFVGNRDVSSATKRIQFYSVCAHSRASRLTRLLARERIDPIDPTLTRYFGNDVRNFERTRT